MSRAVNAEMVRSFASMNKGITAADTYLPPAELRSRGMDMQSALNAAMFGASRTIGRGKTADRMYGEVQKEESIKSSSRFAQTLRAELLKQSDKESALNQAASRLRASEKVLKERLQAEQRRHEREKRTLKEQEGQLKLRQQQNNDRLRKMETNQKSMTLLEMRIRDLQNQMAETNEHEHKTSDKTLETNRKVRELERELLNLGMDNSKLADELEDKLERKDKMFQSAEKSKDESLRGKQRADVQAIALEHELMAQSLKKGPLDEKYANTLEEYRETQNEMTTMQELFTQTKLELAKRLSDEEDANNLLVAEIAEKAKSESYLAADLAEELAAKEVLIAQMEDKDGLCLEMGKRLHKMEYSFVELSRELKDRDGETEGLMQTVEKMKSASKVLHAKLEMEQNSTRKLVSWTQMERLTADELDQKLLELRNNESSHLLTVKQEEAMGERLREKLKETCGLVSTTREALQNCLAEKDFKSEKVKEVDGNLTLLNEKFSKTSALVEKLNNMLNDRTRSFDSKHKAFLFAKNELQGTICEKEDELNRLSARMNKSEDQVNNTQQMLEEAALASEHERIVKSEEINAFDELNVQLESELRQQTNRNKLMETDLSNSEDRIKFASGRMIGNDDKASAMAKLNAEELLELQKRLKKESSSLTDLSSLFNKNKTNLASLIARFDAEDHMKRRLQLNLRNEKHEHNTISAQLEDNKEKELDRSKRIQEYEAERGRLQGHSNNKNNSLESLKGKLTDAVERLDMLKKELHDAEVKESDYLSRQSIDQSTIHQLKGEISIQGEQHAQDANSVKLKIVQLQDALTEKTHTVEKLERAVASMWQRANSLQLRLEQTEAEAAHCQTSFARMLDEEQKDVGALRGDNEQLSRAIMSLRQEDLSKDEVVLGLESKLSEYRSENETLTSEAYRKDRQANTDTISVQRLTVKERDMMQTANDLQEDIVELKLRARGTEHSEQEFHRTLVELENENKLMKHQIAEKMKAERTLLLQLEAQRYHVNDTSGHPGADKRAEEALELLLHNETEKKIY